MLTRRLAPAFGVAIVSLLAAATSAAALSYDGMASVEYSGVKDQSFVYQPMEPAVWQGTLHLVFDDKITVEFYGREEGTPMVKVVSESDTISGTWTNTFAPPNQAETCTGSLSARKGGPSLFSISLGTGNPATVGVTAQIPVEGFSIQSSAPESGQCGVMNQAGGPGFLSPASALAGEELASPAEATVVLPSSNYSKSYTASGSDSQVTDSFNARLEVSTAGKTSGAVPPRRTAAQIQAKRNALDALRDSIPSSLYPCFATVAGATLLGVGLPGQIAGGTLIAVAGPLCATYYSMFKSELETINDPPRRDYGALVSGTPAREALAPTASCKGLSAPVARACSGALSASRALLSRTRAAAQLAAAIEVTVSRESGAQQARKRAAANRQNRRLIALTHSFALARRLEQTAGKRLSRILRADGVTIDMTAGQVEAAQSDLIAGLGQQRVTAADLAIVKTQFRGRPLNILSTLGR